MQPSASCPPRNVNFSGGKVEDRRKIYRKSWEICENIGKEVENNRIFNHFLYNELFRKL
jgi:hypothetical protein